VKCVEGGDRAKSGDGLKSVDGVVVREVVN
jgi:hypothetical protein